MRSVEDRTRPETQASRRWSMPLVCIAGVTVRLHVAFLALVALVALSAGDAGESPVAAVAWLIVLFTCVIAHEFAHALVARSKGIAVHEIELLPIGGVSRLERIPDDWREEAAIAAAGPIASAAIAVLAFLIAPITGQSLLPATLWDGPLVVRLAWVNLMLAAFNLLPAFPLDGGRVLRALLERNRSRVEATHRAAQLSRLLAAAMIGFGVVFNLWLIVIGLFVMVAGRAEEAAVLIHAALGSTPARVLAVPCPVVLPGDISAGQGAEVARLHPQAAYPVIDRDGRFVGLVNLGALHGSPATTPVSELASGVTVDAGEHLEDVAERIATDLAAVTSGGAVVGVISPEILSGYLRQRLHAVDRDVDPTYRG